jgi:hypothetical protein
MKFELNNSFDDNLAIFKADAEKIDPECAKILFDNLHLLGLDSDSAPTRAAIGEFHKAVLTALEALPEPSEGNKPDAVLSEQVGHRRLSRDQQRRGSACPQIQT